MKNNTLLIFLFLLYSCNEANITYNEEDIENCSIKYDYLKEFKTGNSRYDIIISGAGWKPDSFSCTYAYGELIANEYAPEGITDFRIYLIDIKELPIDLVIDTNFFNLPKIKNKTIASQTIIDSVYNHVFDPNNTGKYPKPKQWID